MNFVAWGFGATQIGGVVKLAALAFAVWVGLAPSGAADDSRADEVGVGSDAVGPGSTPTPTSPRVAALPRTDGVFAQAVTTAPVPTQVQRPRTPRRRLTIPRLFLDPDP
ncbi:MAG: hypothetical protein RLP09_14715 [Sandaracinaceae bacterium]